MRDHQTQTAHRIKIFGLCWLAYASIYFGRVNLAIALPHMQQALDFSPSQLGLLGTVFFWVYGTGQWINGRLGDRLKPHAMIFAGLFVTGLTNLVFGFLQTFIIMLIVWSLNGYFQSMLWGPIVRTLSATFDERLASRVSIGISTSMVTGYLLAWGLSGHLIIRTDWWNAFFVPGLFVTGVSMMWFFLHRRRKSPTPTESRTSNVPSMSMRELLFKKKLWPIAIVCMTHGFIKEGLAIWAPFIIMMLHQTDFSTIPSIIVIIPFMNFLGLFAASLMGKLTLHRHRLTVVGMYILGGLALCLLFSLRTLPLFASTVLIGMLSSSMFGANAILLGAIPMQYQSVNMSSSVAGFLDFCSYLAAGISAAVLGGLFDAFGFDWILAIFAGFIVIGICFSLLGHIYQHTTGTEN